MVFKNTPLYTKVEIFRKVCYTILIFRKILEVFMINSERLCLGCMNDNGGEKICPVCGYDSSSSNPESALPTGFILNNRFLVGKMLSVNGEGITYIGWDKVDSSVVNIKEYFPLGFAHRNPDKTVSIVGGGEYTFNEGLLEFEEINKTIMNSELPALIPVISVFEESGTIYAVSANIQGITLENFLQKNDGALKWEHARALFLQLIETVKGMNDIGIFHRAICPETILVGRDGKLRISNYSIKKLRFEDSELNSEMYAGYSAVELYGFDGMHDDTYTDVYGLCATLFRVIIGIAPERADLRLENDKISIPAKFAEELPRHVLAALANGLQVLPQERTRNIEKLKNELVYGEIAEPVAKKRNTAAEQEEKTQEKKKKGSSAKYAIISSVCTIVVFLIIATVLIFTVFKDDVFGGNEPSTSSDETVVNAPVVESIGSIESGAEVTAKQYVVPDLKGKTYVEIMDNDDYEMFDFVITDKSFSSQYPKGTVCGQSVEPKTNAVRDTKIELVISLGPQEIKITNVVGFDEITAKMELLKQGFLYENIEVLEKYDEEKESGVVLEQDPKHNTSINVDETVKIYINSYVEEDEKSDNTDSSSKQINNH